MKKFAFTLAELLTATLVISIIMVALAPVITRRAHDNVAITVNQKQGLEIFATPGIYSFDVPVGINTLFIQGAGGGGGGAGASFTEQSATFLNSTTWTVPKGVNKVTFTLQGGGGGGAGGYGKQGDETCDYIRLPEMADDGRDLCYWNKDMDNVLGYGQQGSNLNIVKPGQASSMSDTCFKYDGISNVSNNIYIAEGGADISKRLSCSQAGAGIYCSCYLPGVIGWNPACYNGDPANRVHETYLMTVSEMQRIINASPAPDYKYLTPEYLDVYMYGSGGEPTTKISRTSMGGGCNYSGSSSNYCHQGIPLSNGAFYWDVFFNYLGTCFYYNCQPRAEYGGYGGSGIPICVYAIKDWFPYGGSGGGSGARLQQEIYVLPDDRLEITVGSGGNGGSAGNNGSAGQATKIVHKRNGSTIATYYANGGYGGNKATTSGVGSATSSANPGCSGGGSCTTVVQSPAGGVGTTGAGGAGSGGVSGGTADAQPISASANSSQGGGGGFCPRSVRSAGSCQRGADGGSGKAIISYKVNLPGGGGGSGARVGGDTSVDGATKLQEIKYKVNESDRIVIKVGMGGSGGVSGQVGADGEATVIGDNHIIFKGGQGGRVGSGLNGGIGGDTAIIIPNDINSSNYSSAVAGLLIHTDVNSKVDYTKKESFIGQKGKQGGVPSGYSITNTTWAYGFTGGTGGAPYGIREGYINRAVSCGGGPKNGDVAKDVLGTTLANTICVSGNMKGNDAKSHDPANNELGGSGGGGGGVTETSTTYGEGGNGAPGFLRIRWNEAEQD